MALISVIMPTYNVEEFFPQCIESVINQTLKDIEIIPVDDGSPDACGKIMDDYAARMNIMMYWQCLENTQICYLKKIILPVLKLTGIIRLII